MSVKNQSAFDFIDTAIAKGESVLKPNRTTLLKDIEAEAAKRLLVLYTNSDPVLRVMASLLNSCHTENKAAFPISKRILEALVQSDKNFAMGQAPSFGHNVLKGLRKRLPDFGFAVVREVEGRRPMVVEQVQIGMLEFFEVDSDTVLGQKEDSIAFVNNLEPQTGEPIKQKDAGPATGPEQLATSNKQQATSNKTPPADAVGKGSCSGGVDAGQPAGNQASEPAPNQQRTKSPEASEPAAEPTNNNHPGMQPKDWIPRVENDSQFDKLFSLIANHHCDRLLADELAKSGRPAGGGYPGKATFKLNGDRDVILEGNGQAYWLAKKVLLEILRTSNVRLHDKQFNENQYRDRLHIELPHDRFWRTLARVHVERLAKQAQERTERAANTSTAATA